VPVDWQSTEASVLTKRLAPFTNGWKRNKKERALNPDLWDRLLKLLPKRKARPTWLRGHSGHAENERADQLAVAALKSPHLEVDTAYERGG